LKKDTFGEEKEKRKTVSKGGAGGVQSDYGVRGRPEVFMGAGPGFFIRRVESDDKKRCRGKRSFHVPGGGAGSKEK